ncbi:hypothetical protein T4C_59 [Trichinella pseudospiralis]|uniref:Uncharacterized protein n=1 Tax=Trichinella pseudospiralis TaxID=6337 RepID=A0A0V1GDG8_TRIPS|nr:hypothetical protein T4C_59 [Trichinella pseudospiralis]
MHSQSIYKEQMVNGRCLKIFGNSSSGTYINVMHNMDF